MCSVLRPRASRRDFGSVLDVAGGNDGEFVNCGDGVPPETDEIADCTEPGLVGNAFSFDGSVDPDQQGVLVDNPIFDDNLDPTELTLSAWIKPTANPTGVGDVAQVI